MDSLLTVLRRTLWIVMLAAAGGIAYGWWRERAALTPADPPSWPPLAPAPPAAGDGAPSAPPAVGDGAPSEPPAVDSSPASVVNALVDTPDARSSAGVEARWVEPIGDGSCPTSHPIKANDNSGIFHVPGGRFYDRTRPERCYADPDAAVADGYRQAKQ